MLYREEAILRAIGREGQNIPMHFRRRVFSHGTDEIVAAQVWAQSELVASSDLLNQRYVNVKIGTNN